MRAQEEPTRPVTGSMKTVEIGRFELPNATVTVPGDRHWAIFEHLCARAKASGKLAQDAWFAALAIESGAEWITTDRDYAHFPGLTWRSPL